MVLHTSVCSTLCIHLSCFIVFSRIQKSLDQLLRFLDTSVGRPLMATQVAGKTEEELCG